MSSQVTEDFEEGSTSVGRTRGISESDFQIRKTISPRKTRGSHVRAMPGRSLMKSASQSTRGFHRQGPVKAEELVYELEPRVRPVAPADLRGRQAVGQDDVGGEVVVAA